MDPSKLASLARLVVTVLHIGERKADRMATELCATFGIDIDAKEADPGGYDPKKVERIQAEVVHELTSRCPSPEALMVAFARSGAVVIAMLDEIYRLLSDHSASTSGTSERHPFHLVADDLDLTLSDAFFEEIETFVSAIISVELGTFDTEQLRLFVGLDNGESYGSFPTEGGRPLLHEIQVLRPIRSRIEARSAEDGRWSVVLDAHDRATTSAERLLDRLEEVLAAWAAGIVADERDRPGTASETSTDDWGQQQRAVERATLLEEGVIGGPVATGLFEGLENTFVGMRVLDSSGEPVATPSPITDGELLDRFGHVPSALGCYLGLRRGGFDLIEDRWSAHGGAHGLQEEVVSGSDPGAAVAWLDAVSVAADEATKWIDGGLWIPNGQWATTVDDSAAERFLNLPLWEDRAKLFEVWALCRTLRATEAAGWATELTGLVGEDWMLPGARAQEPVARIRRSTTVLDVWREPDRGVTPDVTIATSPPWSRDLVVLEVKDRNRMPSGFMSDGTVEEGAGTMAGRALSYVRTLGAPLTWVWNHCPGKGILPATGVNIGTPWHHVHLADRVAPRTVPPAFDTTILATLSGAVSRSAIRQLTLVLDTTQSMHDFIEQIGPAVRGVPSAWFDTFTAILVGDHGDRYVVHEVDPVPSPETLWTAIQSVGMTHGGDTPEALEDAMHLARSTARPGTTFVVVTDAPPHAADSCPEHLDFAAEVAGTLAEGAEIRVISDRLGTSRSVWEPFASHPGFAFIKLDQLEGSLDPSR